MNMNKRSIYNIEEKRTEPRENSNEVKLLMDLDYHKLADCLAHAVAGIFPEPPTRTPGTVEMPELMTFSQASKYLQISENSLRNLIESKKLKCTKICSMYRISTNSITEYLNETEEQYE